MSVSGSRAAVEINLEEFEKRLRAAGAPHPGAEDPLSELARLVETARPAPQAASVRAVETASRPAPAMREVEPPPIPVSEPTRPAPSSLDDAALRPALEEADTAFPDNDEEAVAVDAEDALEFRGAPAPAKPASRKWMLAVSGLAIAGVAMLGGAFALRSGLMLSLPGASKTPPFITADKGPTRVQPPSDATVAAPADAGALMKDSNPSAPVKVVTSEEQPVDLAAQAATAKTAAPPAAAPSAPASAVASDTPMKGTVDTPLVVGTTGSPPTSPSQFPDPKPVRTVSLRPDGTPVPSSAMPVVASTPAPVAQSAAAAPAAKPPAPATPQASTPKIELPTKLNGKSSARVVVAKTDTTAPAAGDAGEPTQLVGKPDKPAKPAKTHEATAEAKAPTAAEPADAAEATSGGWSVQLAAPRSEAEAKTTAAKLNDKYASALSGAPIGVHKATVRGDTIYRLRVGGLSKADAAAMCARIKGEGGQCFISK